MFFTNQRKNNTIPAASATAIRPDGAQSFRAGTIESLQGRSPGWVPASPLRAKRKDATRAATTPSTRRRREAHLLNQGLNVLFHHCVILLPSAHSQYAFHAAKQCSPNQ